MAKIRKRTRDGRTTWLADHRDGSGARRFRTFSTRREAELFLAQAITAVRAGTYTPDSTSETVLHAGQLWLARGQANGLERTTLKQYAEHLNLHIVPAIGTEKLSRLTTPGIEAFADRLVEKLSRPLAAKVLTSLKGIIAEAQRRGLVAQNVAAPVKIVKSMRDEERANIPGKEELRLMLDKVGELTARWRPFLITAMLTGLRASELRGLTWSAVDLDRRTLRVEQRADCFKTMGAPKSRAGRRDVPLSPMVVNALREWKLRCPRGNFNLVFPNTAGGMMNPPDYLRLCWYPLLAACALSGRYEFHDLRHVAASLWIEQGATPKRVQAIMGHSSIRVTFDTYGHLFTDSDADQALVAGAERSLLGM